MRKTRSLAAPMFPGANFESVQHIKFKKETTDLMSFFSAFSRLVQPHEIQPVAGTVGAPPNMDLFIEIRSAIKDPNTYVMFPLSLANLFKLPQRQIWKGSLLASGLSAQSEFNEIPMDTEFDIQVVTASSVENRIELEEQVECMFFIRAPSTENHTNFFAKISNQFFLLGYSVAFDFNDKDNVRVSVFSLRRVPTDFIIIPEKLAEALGLENVYLKSGVHESMQPFQFEKFKLIKQDERLWFTYSRNYTTIYHMLEPAAHDYKSMLRAINVALNENYLPYLRVKFDYIENELVITDGPDSVRVELPEAVNKFYNFPTPGTFFHKGQGQRLPQFIQDEIAGEEILREEQGVNPEPVDNEPPHHVVVQCNVVENGIVGGRDFPTLRVLHNTLDHSNKGRISWAGEPVIFLPLDREHLYYIKLRLITEKGALLELDPQSETTANLVFRQKA